MNSCLLTRPNNLSSDPLFPTLNPHLSLIPDHSNLNVNTRLSFSQAPPPFKPPNPPPFLPDSDNFVFTDDDTIPIPLEDQHEIDREHLPPVPNNGINTLSDKFLSYKHSEALLIASSILRGDPFFRFKIRWFDHAKYHIKIPIVDSDSSSSSRQPFSIKAPDKVKCVGWSLDFPLPSILKASSWSDALLNAHRFIDDFYSHLNRCTQLSNSHPRLKPKFSPGLGSIIHPHIPSSLSPSSPDSPPDIIKFYGLTIKVNDYHLDQLSTALDKFRSIFLRLIDPHINIFPLLRFHGEPSFYLIIEVGPLTGLIHAHAVGVYNLKSSKKQVPFKSSKFHYYYFSRSKDFENDNIQIFLGTDNKYHKELKTRDDLDNWLHYMEKDLPTSTFGNKHLVLHARDLFL